jgi:hypothetical protein
MDEAKSPWAIVPLYIFLILTLTMFMEKNLFRVAVSAKGKICFWKSVSVAS